MFTHPIWPDFSDVYNYPELRQSIAVDVAIIGGGITGVSAGKLISQEGKSVAVLESRKIGGGTTSHSTGNLYFTIDKILSSVQSKYGDDTVRQVANSRQQALQQIETWINDHNLDCDFHKVPWYLYSKTESSRSKIEQELEMGQRTGLTINKATNDEIPYPSVNAVKVPDQAQINPMRYVQELAQTLGNGNCQIYEHTKVTSVKRENSHYILKTSNGVVKARYVVHATHSPKGIMLVQSLLGPYREYGIACKVTENSHPKGIFWGYYEGGSKISTRTYSRGDEQFVIVVGEPHKVGQADSNVQSIRNLESFANAHYNVQEITHRWGGQHYRPADLLPYIGPRKRNSREFIATGFSTDGLVYGTLAGLILSDLIMGRENPWAELYRSTRKQPFKSAAEFLKENLNVAKQYVKDLPPGVFEQIDLELLNAGEGKVTEKNGQKLAIYRKENGELEVVSATCTHMKCIVHWNNAEKSWDCPCHGSRFQTDGSVLEGPAYHNLQKVRISDKPDNSTE